MLQSALPGCVAFDPFSLQQDSMTAPEVDVGGCQISDAFMVSLVIVVLDEGGDLGFKVFGEEVVFEQDAVLQSLVPALDLALGLRMARRTVDLFYGPLF